MKKVNQICNICFCAILFFVFSCNKEDVITENPETIETKTISVKDGRVVFKNKTILHKTVDKLKDMDTEQKIEWARQLGFKSYLASQQACILLIDSTQAEKPSELEDLSDWVPPIHSPIFNDNKEMQVGDTIIWRHKNIEYRISGADQALLRRLKTDVQAGRVVDGNNYPRVEVCKTSIVVIPLTENGGMSTKAQVEGGPTYQFTDGGEHKNDYQFCAYMLLSLADEPDEYAPGSASSYEDNWNYRFVLQYKKSNMWGSWWSEAGEVYQFSGNSITLRAYPYSDRAMLPPFDQMVSRGVSIPSYTGSGTKEYYGYGIQVWDCNTPRIRIHSITFGGGTMYCYESFWESSHTFSIPERDLYNPDSRVN